MKKAVLFVFILILIGVSHLAALDSKGIYVGIMVPYNGIAGSDFSGDKFFDLGTQLVFIPKIKNGLGWGIVVGKSADTFDVEIYYMHSSHDTTFLDVSDKATLDAIGLDWRWYLLKARVLRPYVNIACDFSYLTAVNAAIQVDWPYRQGDAKFIGIGLCGGGGITLSPMDHLALFVGAEVRWNPMGKVKGYEGNYETTKDLDSLGLSLRSGIYYRF